jgi:hypothetical protein
VTNRRNAVTAIGGGRKTAVAALVYSVPMSTATHTRLTLSAPVRDMLHASAIIVGVWSALVALGALGNYSDLLRRGEGKSYALLLWRWWREHTLLILFSCACHALFTARPAALGSMRSIGRLHLLAVAILVPLIRLASSYFELRDAGGDPGLHAALRETVESQGLTWFMDFAWVTFTYSAIVAACSWRQGRVRQRDNLKLSLELEQQRLLALRGQLEPHFLFNALNAISALVRADDKRVALGGIGHLSELLRYALQAGERDYVALADECRFVDDYLALQKLRYGERLQLAIEADPQALAAGQVPPLLLQPLIENAMRHDLDCHDGPSDIRLALRAAGTRLSIHVSNPVAAARSANPGLGIGLRQTRARLQLSYGGDAVLHAGEHAGRFAVDIDLPLYPDRPA